MNKSRSTTKGYFGALAECIEKDGGCEAIHAGTVPVKEVFNGVTVWDGEVEVYDLAGHPNAARCYAWAVQSGDDWEVTTVLEIPPVVSPQTAVKAAIVARARQAKPQQ